MKYEPDSILMEFIKLGPPPIIISLGAMGFETVEEKSKLDILIIYERGIFE
ncbi:MAG: hypothetical protein K0R21_2058 [Anaerocolumna sp.]|jgi:hypothetical protein|nr:hypothetical protein [Anaerocolumna sp.]